MTEACCYRTRDNNVVECNLCIINCKIKDGGAGFCGVRENQGGTLINTIYGKLSSFSTDFIEKAPLYHFYPNHKFMTIGSVGCNMKCDFCLTWSITQVDLQSVKTDELGVEKVIKSARELDCKGIVFTHSEPALNIEYYKEIMEKAKEAGLVNVFATNGLVTLEAFESSAPYVDAVALTIKGSEDFYKEVCGVKIDKSHFTTLVKKIKEKGIHLEIVYVLIPGQNDDEESLDELFGLAKDADAPLIFLRFFPSHKMDNLDSTTEAALEKALNAAYEGELSYVYMENIFAHPGKNTYCGKCRKVVIEREGYGIVEWNIEGGKCGFCGAKIPVIGEAPL
jgi:pyruvate formate lyase activating enzyme